MLFQVNPSDNTFLFQADVNIMAKLTLQKEEILCAKVKQNPVLFDKR